MEAAADAGYAILHVIGALVPFAAVADADGPTTGYVYHTDYTLHDTGPGHPERPVRVETIARALRQSSTWPALLPVAPRVASATWLTTVHSPQYLEQLRDAATQAPLRLDADTVMSSHSYRVALFAAGGALAAVDAIMQRRVRNAFVASRPPGHHAFADRASGFCLINNVAVAARYVQRKHGLERVLIVDWDVHLASASVAHVEVLTESR